MEKRRLFKTLFGLALTAAFVQGLQAAARIPAAPPIVVAVPIPTRSIASRLASWTVNRTLDYVPASAKSTVSSVFEAAKTTLNVPITIARAVADLIPTIAAPQAVRSSISAAVGYTVYHGAEKVLTTASKNGLVTMIPFASTTLKVASWAPYLGKFLIMADLMEKANTATPSNGIVIKDPTEHDKVKISGPGFLATAKIGAMGAAAYTMQSALINKLSGAPAQATTSTFAKSFATVALLYNAHKAYKEFYAPAATPTPTNPAAVLAARSSATYDRVRGTFA